MSDLDNWEPHEPRRGESYWGDSVRDAVEGHLDRDLVRGTEGQIWASGPEHFRCWTAIGWVYVRAEFDGAPDGGHAFEVWDGVR